MRAKIGSTAAKVFVSAATLVTWAGCGNIATKDAFLDTVSGTAANQQASSPLKAILLSSSATSAAAGACFGPITATLVDGNNQTAATGIARTVSLTYNGAGNYYSDAACANVTTTISFAPGDSSNTFYFRSTSSGFGLIYANSQGLTGSTLPFDVLAGPPVGLNLHGPAAATSGTCSTAFTVSLLDQFGVNTQAVSDQIVSLGGGGAGTFYTDASCSTAVTQITIAAGSQSSVFYFKDNQGEILTLSSTSNPLNPSTQLFTVSSPAAPSRLAISSSTAFGTAGVCAGPITITTTDATGSAMTVGANTTVSLSNTGSGSFYTSSSCSTSATSLTIPAGSSSGTIYFQSNTAATQNFLASASGLSATSYPFSVLAAPAATISMAGPSSVASGTCSSVLIVSLQDSFGNTAKAASALTLNLGGTGSGSFYSNSTCTTAVTTASIASGASSTNLYFKDTTGESLSLSASSGSLTSGTWPLTINGTSSPTKLSISTTTGFAVAGVCTPVTVTATDNSNNPISVSSNLSVNFNNSGSGGFYTSSVCTTSATSATMTSGSSTTTLYFQSTLAENQNLSASATGLTSSTYPFTVIANTPAQLAVTGVGSIGNSVCSAAFTVKLIDGFGNTAKATSNMTVNLTGGGAGAFYTDAGCATSATSVSVASNTTSATFYFKDATAESLTLTAASGSLNNGSLPLTIGSSASASNLALSASPSLTSAGTCYGPITVTTTTSTGTSVAVGSNLTVTLTNTGSGSFYTTAACSTTTTSVTVASGSFQAQVYFKDTVAENQTFKADATSFAEGALAFSVLAGAPASIVLAGPSSLANATCSTAYTATLKDANGNSAKAGTTLAISLTGGGSGTFYSDAGCTTSTTTVSVPVGSNSTTFYFKDASGESLTLNGASGALTAGTQAVTVAAPAGATKLALSSATGFAVAGVCTQVTVKSTDNAGTPVAVGSNTTVNLTNTGAGGYYSDAGCTTSATTATISSGSNTTSLYFKDTTAENQNLIASASGLTSSNYAFSVVANSAHSVTLSGVGTLSNGTCSAAFTVSLLDSYGNFAKSSGTTTISLSGAGSGSFYSDSGCGTLATTVNVANNTTSSTVYFKDSTAESLTLTAAGGGLVSGTLPLTVGASATATNLALSASSAFSVAGACFGPITVTTTTAGGSPVAVGSNLTVSLVNSNQGSFYTSSACSTTASSVTVNSGTFQAQVYFMSTSTESTTFLASATGLTGASLPFSVVAGAPTVITMTGPTSVANATCSSAFTLGLQDAYGNTAKAVSNLTINLSGSGSGAFYSNGGCSTSTTTASIGAGSSSTSFYFKDSTGETLTLSGASGALTSGTEGIVVSAASTPTKLVLSSVSGFAVAGVCTPITITSTDNSNNPIVVSSNTSVTLTNTGSGGYFSDNACGTSAATVTVASGASVATAYFSSTQAGNQNLIASATGLTSSNYAFAVVAGTPTKITLTGAPTLPNATCSAAVTVGLSDAYGNGAKSSGSTTINLTGGGSGTFYSDSGCGTSVTSVSIANNASNAVFYFKDSTAETLNLSAAGTSLTTGTLNVAVSASAAATQLTMSGGASFTTAGTCFGPITVTTTSSTGSPVAVGSNLSVTLSNSGSGSFYTTSACSTTATTVTVTSGSSTAQVYFKDTLAENQNLLASATAFTGATVPFSVLAGAPAAIIMAGPSTLASGSCSSAIAISFQDAFGNASKAASATTITLGGAGAGNFYTTSACSTTATTATVAVGNSSTNVYFKDGSGESLTLSATSGSLTAGSWALTTTAASTPTKLAISTSTGFAVAGVCTPVTVTATDNAGTAISVSSNLTINFNNTGSGGFFSNSGCSTAATSATLASGTNNTSLYFQSTVAGNQNLLASTTGLTSSNYPFTVVANSPAQIALTGVGSLANGTCSAAFGVALQDAYSNAAKSSGSTTISLTGAGNGTYYSDAGCTTSVTSVSIPNNGSSTSIYFKDSTPESLTLTAASGSLTSGTLAVSVGAGASATNLALQVTPTFTTSGTCFGPINVTTTTSGGTSVAVASNLTVTLSNSGSGSFYTTSACSTTTTSVTVNAGSYQAPVYFKDTLAESQTLAASAASFAGANLPFTISAAAPASIALSGPSTLSNATCSGAYTATLKDANANVAKAASSLTVNLSGAGSGTFYSDAGCSSAVTTAPIALGASSATFYFKDSTGETVTLSAANGSLTSGTQSVTVSSPPGATKLALSSASGFAVAGACTAVTVTSTDSSGTPTAVSSNTTVSLTNTGSGGFFTTSGCGTAATTATISSGTNSSTVYFLSSVAQSQNLLGSASGLSSANYPFSVVAAAPSQVVLTGVGTLSNATCSAAFTATLQDAYGNTAKSSGTTTINLSGNGSGTYYSDSGCGTSATSVSVANNASGATFYFKDATAQTLTLTAASGSLSSGTLSLVVGASATATNLAISATSAFSVAGSCFGPITVTTTTSGGSAVAVGSNLTVNLVNSGSGSFYTTSACSTTTSSVTVSSGTFSGQVYFQSNAAGSTTFLASATSFTGSSLPFSVVAGAPAAIVFSGQTSLASATCSSAYALTLQDAFGNTAKAASATTLNLSGAGAGAFYSDSGCATSATTASIGVGSSTTSIYFKSPSGGSLTLTAASSGLTSGTLGVTVSAASTPTKLALSSATGFAVAGVCTQVVVTSTDNSNNPIAVGSSATVNFANTGNGSFFSDAACTTDATSATMSSGTSTTYLYFLGTLAGSQNLLASASGLSSSTYPFSIVAGSPSQVSLTGVGSLANSTCSAAYTVGLMDAYGNSTKASGATTINLTGGGAGTFYSNSNCASSITSLSIPNNGTTGTFYFKDATAQSLTLSAAGTGLTAGTLGLVINPSAVATQLALSASASFATAGTCFGPITVTTTTSGGTAIAVSSNTTVNLSNSGSGSFYTTSACSTTTTSVTVSSGSFQGQVYFKDTLAEAQTFLAGATSFTGGSMPFSILSDVPASIFISGSSTLANAACSTAYSLSLQDAYGNTAKAGSALTLNLSGGSNGTYYSNSNCSTSTTTASIGVGSSSVNVYFKDSTGESLTLTAASGSLTNGTIAVTVSSASTGASKLALSSATGFAVAGVCTQVTATSTDNSGNAVAIGSNTTVNFANTGSGSYFSDSGCTTAATSATLASGSSTTSLYFKSNLVENQNLLASATALASSNYAFAVVAAAPAAIVVTGVGSLANSTCSSAFTVTLQDAFGNTAKAASSTTINLTGKGSGNFYTNSSCGTTTSSATVAANNASTTFFFQDGSAENLTLSAAGTSLTTGTLALTVSASASATNLALSAASSFTTAGTCFGPVNVMTTTSGGASVAVASNLTVNLSNSGSGSFYTTSACSTIASTVTISSGTFQSQVYYQSTTAQNLSFLASATSFVGASLPFSVIGGSPASIAITGSSTLGGGACSSAYTVALNDSYGNLAKAAANTTVNLSGGGSGTFYTNSACSSATTSVSIAAAASSATFYFKDMSGESLSLAGAATGLTSGGINVTVSTPSLPTKLTFSLPSGFTTAGTCFGPVTIQSTDNTSQPIAVVSNTTVSLSGGGSGAFYTTLSCASSTTSATITAGTNSVNVYFKDATAENLVFSASTASLSTGTYPFSVTANPPSAISLAGSSILAASTCSSAMTAALVDNNGNPAKPTSAQTVNLTGGGGGLYYSDSGCSTQITSLSIPTTASSGVFYFKDVTTETATLTAGGSGLTSGSMNVSVTAGAPIQLSLQTPTSVTAGLCSAALTITSRDVYGNAANVTGGNKVVALSGQSNATFYSDSSCATSISSITINNGTSSATFYVKDSIAETLNITGASSGFVSAGGSYTISSNSVNKLAITGPSTITTYTCTSAFTVTAQDFYGNAVNVASTTAITLGGAGAGGGFYTANDCSGSPVTSVNISAGTSSKQYYFQTTTPGSLTLTGASSGLFTANYPFNVTSLPATQLVLTGPTTGTSNRCTSVYTVTAQDYLGHTALVSSNTTVTLGGNQQGFFYSDSACTNVISSATVTISASTSSATFYFKNRSGQSVTLTASASGFSPGGTLSYSQTPSLTGIDLIAGGYDRRGYMDGSTGTAVRFTNPSGILGDGTYIYVADTYNCVIRRMTIATGAWSVWLGAVGNCGHADGTGTAAKFDRPYAMTILSGNMYVTDGNNHTIRKVVVATGVVSTFAGVSYSSGTTNGTGSGAKFNVPFGITNDGTNLYVSDNNNHCIRKLTTGAVVTTLSGTCGTAKAGFTNSATAASNKFNYPCEMVYDGTNLFVADSSNNAIRQVTTAGVGTTLAGQSSSGSSDGTGTAAQFNDPVGLAIQGTTLYVADSNNHTIRTVVTTSGVVATVAGSFTKGYVDGTGAAVQFDNPQGAYSDGTNLWISEWDNSMIRQMNLTTLAVTTFAGPSALYAKYKWNGYTEGTFGTSYVSNVNSMVETGGYLYFTDRDNFRIRRMALGTTSTSVLAGNGTWGADLDGTGTGAELAWPQGITTDGTNLYVTTNTHCVRKIVIATSVVTTVAGICGSSGYTDSATSTSVQFNNPQDVAVDTTATNLYVWDSNNAAIRKVVIATGATTTFAGGASSGFQDGTGTAARFGLWSNTGMVRSTDGTKLYLSDTNNHAIRQVTVPGAVVTTIAGTGSSGYLDGTGTSAIFNHPNGIATDGTNLYIWDYYNSVIRKMVINTGVVSTMIGTYPNWGDDDASMPSVLQNINNLYYSNSGLFMGGWNNIRLLH